MVTTLQYITWYITQGVWVTTTSTAQWPRPCQGRPVPTPWALSSTSTCCPATSATPPTAGPGQCWSEQEKEIRVNTEQQNKEAFVKLIAWNWFMNRKNVFIMIFCETWDFRKCAFMDINALSWWPTWILLMQQRFRCDWQHIITAMREWLCQYFLWLYFLWHVKHKYLYNPPCLY